MPLYALDLKTEFYLLFILSCFELFLQRCAISIMSWMWTLNNKVQETNEITIILLLIRVSWLILNDVNQTPNPPYKKRKVEVNKSQYVCLWLFGKGNKKVQLLPLQICTIPMMMMRMRANSFPAVNTSWTRVAQRTLAQFTHVSNTTTHR